MEVRFPVSRDELQSVQMDVRQMQVIQHNHEDRLSRLEKRHVDDVAMKSVWNSPFPSVIGGTPQHGTELHARQHAQLLMAGHLGPVSLPTNEVFDDFDEPNPSLLGSLHLEADDEPARRGAASRANSVRFDESALQGTGWTQHGRHSGDFVPARPGSAFGGHGLMERSLSHKSDGRHSSAGQSVHSLHSAPSGRASSLGLDTNFTGVGHEGDSSPMEMTAPPPGFFVLGSVPAIVRCWLTTEFAHNTMLYAVLCTGSQRSAVEYSLLRELDLLGAVSRDLDGVSRIQLPVYLSEAILMHANPRSPGPAPQVPSITVRFDVLGMDDNERAEAPGAKKSIRIFIGSDALRCHCADLLFSQNKVQLLGNEREKLFVPFIRPEDDGMFKNITTANMYLQKPALQGSAPPFVPGDRRGTALSTASAASEEVHNDGTSTAGPLSSADAHSNRPKESTGATIPPEGGAENEKPAAKGAKPTAVDGGSAPPRDTASVASDATSGTGNANRRESAASGIWGSWRTGSAPNGSDAGSTRSENGLSGYQPAGSRGSGTRSMKVLKPLKSGGGSSSNSARTGAAYEPAPPPRSSGELRRKSEMGVGGGGSGSSAGGSTPATPSVRWETAKRNSSGSGHFPAGDLKSSSAASTSGSASSTTPLAKDAKAAVGSQPRKLNNPIGGASAFSWMNSGGPKPKTPAAAAE